MNELNDKVETLTAGMNPSANEYITQIITNISELSAGDTHS